MIDTSLELQYLVELGIDGMVDCPDSPFTTAQRHRMLLDLRHAWARLDWKQRKSVDVPGTSNAFDFAAGVFAKTTRHHDRDGRHFVAAWLPSQFEDGQQLEIPDIGFFASNLTMDPSQDLIAFVASDNYT
jgi:hypothetical protein